MPLNHWRKAWIASGVIHLIIFVVIGWLTLSAVAAPEQLIELEIAGGGGGGNGNNGGGGGNSQGVSEQFKEQFKAASATPVPPVDPGQPLEEAVTAMARATPPATPVISSQPPASKDAVLSPEAQRSIPELPTAAGIGVGSSGGVGSGSGVGVGDGANDGTGAGTGMGLGSGTGSGVGSGSGAGVGSGSGSAVGAGNLRGPSILRQFKPEYPPDAQMAGIEGTVVVRIQVLTNGKPGEVIVSSSSGNKSIDRSVVTAVKRWRFVPAKDELTGRAVVCYTTNSIKFKFL